MLTGLHNLVEYDGSDDLYLQVILKLGGIAVGALWYYS